MPGLGSSDAVPDFGGHLWSGDGYRNRFCGGEAYTMKCLFCFLLVFLFFGGVLLAGSDGGWFPWINLVGVVMISAFGMIGNMISK